MKQRSRPTRFQPKIAFFWPVFLVVFLADCTSKSLAVERLGGGPLPHEIFGSWLRLTLTYNTGAAMGIDLGALSQPLLGAIAVAALIVLFRAYRTVGPSASPVLPVALGLLASGALGNLWDRVRWSRGVVDFIDVGIGAHRFWTFNVADMSLTLGGMLLLWYFWWDQSGADQHP